MGYPFPAPYPGPIPPETNVIVEPQYYQPSRFVISDVSLGITTLVTTSVPHNYVVGQQVRLLIPFTYGCYQLNGTEGFISSIPSDDQVVVTINSVGANNFIANPVYGPTPPQIIALGDVNTGDIGNSGRVTNTFIPGSFINVSTN
jgi:hypothetical protein